MVLVFIIIIIQTIFELGICSKSIKLLIERAYDVSHRSVTFCHTVGDYYILYQKKQKKTTKYRNELQAKFNDT